MHSKTFRKFRQESLTVYTLHVNYPYTGSNSTVLSSTMTFTHPTAFSTYSYFLAILIFQISKQPWSTSQWVQHTESFLIHETHCKNVKELEKGKGDVLELYVITGCSNRAPVPAVHWMTTPVLTGAADRLLICRRKQQQELLKPHNWVTFTFSCVHCIQVNKLTSLLSCF